MLVNALRIRSRAKLFGVGKDLDTQGGRLAWARLRAGFKKPIDAARAMGVKEQTYYAHESTSRGLRTGPGQKYARRFKVNFSWLMTGQGKPTDRDTVPVVSYVGAGSEVYSVDDHSPAGLEQVDAPTGGDIDSVAARVRGESMYPMLRDGWLIFWRRSASGVPSDCLNHLCIVKIADGGPTLVKTLRNGSKVGFFSLESWNAPTRENVKLDWAAKVIDIRPD